MLNKLKEFIVFLNDVVENEGKFQRYYGLAISGKGWTDVSIHSHSGALDYCDFRDNLIRLGAPSVIFLSFETLPKDAFFRVKSHNNVAYRPVTISSSGIKIMDMSEMFQFVTWKDLYNTYEMFYNGEWGPCCEMADSTRFNQQTA